MIKYPKQALIKDQKQANSKVKTPKTSQLKVLNGKIPKAIQGAVGLDAEGAD